MRHLREIKNKNWFTLIETLVGIVIVSMIIVVGFSALSAIMIWKVKLIEKTAIQKEAFYFSEKLFEMIKTGGTIDYEEYWNRHSYTPIDDPASYGSGHFLNPTWFGNHARWWVVGTNNWGWNNLYFCISKDWDSFDWDGCLSDFNISRAWTTHIDYSWDYQNYNQYRLQFIDYNSDADSDLWDEDSSGESLYNFISDDDDLYLGKWPEAFPAWINTSELYLINADWDERMYFRLNISLDPNAPSTATCTWTQTMTWTWCLWTIEFLKLTWTDAWYDHANNWGRWDGDWLIDTWLIHNDFHASVDPIIAGSDTVNYWQPLFPESLHVKDVQFFPYPNKDLNYSWRDTDPTVNIAPYVRISMTLTPSWKSRKKIRGALPEIEINTTVQLTDIFN